MNRITRILSILRVTDTSPGHIAQSAGLIKAIASLVRVNANDVPTGSILPAIARTFRGAGADSPRDLHPHLIVCCGHKTHLTGLALRAILGGRLVVLMKPTLPLWLFDLAVVPRHDRLQEDRRTLLTYGALNPLTAKGPHHSNRGLILIGGPSRHHNWDQPSLLDQLHALSAATPKIQWTVTTSRRTPAETTRALLSLRLPGIEIVPVEHTGPDWVARQLAEASAAWITEDSVSMVYEALTAGVAVGLLDVPHAKSSRVARGVDDLVAQGRVVRFAQWRAGGELPRTEPLAEADRVALEILSRWYPSHLAAGSGDS